MGGRAKNSTFDAIIRDPPSLSLKSKTAIASEASQKLSGNLFLDLVSLWVIAMQCYLI